MNSFVNERLFTEIRDSIPTNKQEGNYFHGDWQVYYKNSPPRDHGGNITLAWVSAFFAFIILLAVTFTAWTLSHASQPDLGRSAIDYALLRDQLIVYGMAGVIVGIVVFVYMVLSFKKGSPDFLAVGPTGVLKSMQQAERYNDYGFENLEEVYWVDSLGMWCFVYKGGHPVYVSPNVEIGSKDVIRRNFMAFASSISDKSS